jgi:acetolactate synthase-1/2/3 large subunit
MVKSITKKAYKPQTAAEVLIALNEAWLLCQEGRKGPVLIDIPINLQQEFIEYDFPSPPLSSKKIELSTEIISEFRDYLLSAKHPLLLVGGGVRLSDATELLSEFVDRTGIPYVSTLLGIDSISHINDKYLGFIGSYGNRWANAAVKQSDLLIVLGSRLDVRQTGDNISKFISDKKIVRVDIDDHELSGRITADFKIKSDVKDFLQAVMEIKYTNESSKYISRIRDIEKNHPQELEPENNLSFCSLLLISVSISKLYTSL